jgi:subtilisin family serine protease
MRTVKFFTILLVLALCATAFAQNVKPMKVSGPVDYAPDQFIARFNPGAPGQAIAALHAQNGTKLKRDLPHGMKLIQVPPGKSVEDLVNRFNKNPNVEFAHVDAVAYASFAPNDGFYGYQWHFDNINMQAAWDIETGDPNVIVAVADTGLNTGGEDTPINLIPGYDFAYGDSDTRDGDGHGTHVSGTIAQATNNGTGVAGVAFGVSLMPVKVLDDSGSGYISSIIDGIDFAVANGADVISMSLGFPPGYVPGDGLQVAVTEAYNSGVVMVAASGNDSTTDEIGYPAAYGEVIAVGATDFNNVVSYYSNQGPGLEVVAPGGDTTVDNNGDGYVDGVLQETFGYCSPNPRKGCDFGYYFYQGTSMATPHVSGVVGLLLSHGAGDGLTGSAKVEAVRNILHTTSVDLGSNGWDTVYGYGLVDALAALEAVAPQPPPPPPECVTADDCADDGVACTITACDSGTCVHNPSDAYCDDGKFCNGGETCDAALGCQAGDFPCSAGQMCTETTGCYDPCTSNSECYDGDDCTSDVCNLSTGECSNNPVTVCDLDTNDGCCPAGCDYNTDIDCVPPEPCGDGFCAGAQLGEDCDTCPADCGCISRDCRKGCCGDYICTKWENADSCPIDCQ